MLNLSLIRVVGVSWAFLYLLIVSKKRCLPPYKHPALLSRGHFVQRQTPWLPEQFTAAGSRDRSRDLVWADGREVGAEVERCPRRVRGDRGTSVQLLFSPSVPEVHGQRMTSDEDVRSGKKWEMGGGRFGWGESHICWVAASLSLRVWFNNVLKSEARVRTAKKPIAGNIRQKEMAIRIWGQGNKITQGQIAGETSKDLETRRAGIMWKVQAAALNGW